MKRNIVFFSFLFFLVAKSVYGGALPKKGSFSVNGHLGYGTLAMGDVNDSIDQIEDVLRDLGVPANFDNVGGSVFYGGSVAYQISEALGLDIAATYQTKTVDNRYTDQEGSFSDEVQVEIFDVVASLQLWVPSAPGFLLGVGGGFGKGETAQLTSVEVFVDPGSSQWVHGEGDGSGFVFGVFAGYRVNLSNEAHLLMQAGYDHRNLGSFEATVSDSEGGRATGTTENEYDFSGIYIALGLGLHFGGN